MHRFLYATSVALPGWDSSGSNNSVFIGRHGDFYPWEKFIYYFQDAGNLFLLLFPLVLTTAYFLLVYFRKRYIPKYPDGYLTDPPLGLSPAAMRYISQMGFDTKCLVVGILNASVKGCYNINWRKDRFRAVLATNADFEQLSLDEQLALSYNKENYWGKVIITNTHSTKTMKMSRRMDDYLKKRYGRLINLKRREFIIGAIISGLAGTIAFALSDAKNGLFIFLGYILVMIMGLVLPMVFLTISMKDKYWYGLIISIMYLGAGLTALYFMERFSDAPFIFMQGLPLLAINVLFYKLLPTYTHNGMRLMNLILAYRSYLDKRFKLAEEMGNADESYYAEMPYAMALDLDYRQTQYFQKILSRTKYTPYRVLDYFAR